MNSELTNLINGVQSASKECTEKLISVMRRYELTELGVEGERQRLFADVIEKEKQAETRATDLIDAKIREIDAAEHRAAEQRAKDTAYLNRLHLKIGMLGSVDLQKVTDGTLTAMFAEFADDPFALEMIRAAIPGGRPVSVSPANGCGARQEHLRKVKEAVIRALRKAGAYISPTDLKSGNILTEDEVNALKAYISAQNEEFSKDDATVWAELVKKGRASDVYAWLWQTKFSNSR